MPTTWAELQADAVKLQQAYPGTTGFDAITNDTNAFASFIWGAGGQIATQNSGGQWTADLTSPQTEAAIKYYVGLYTTAKVSASKYIGETELGVAGATSGGPNEDFGLGKLDMYVDGSWAKATLPKNSVDMSNIASFPIPSQNGPNPAPVFSGGSDLAVFKTSPNQTAAWDLISVMDNPTNSTSFAALSGFFSPYSAQISASESHRRRVQRGLRQGRPQRPDLPAQRQELAHRRQRQAQHHPDDAEVADAGGAVRLHGGLRQHPAAVRAQHRQRQLAAYLPMVTSSHSRPGTSSPAGAMPSRRRSLTARVTQPQPFGISCF